MKIDISNPSLIGPAVRATRKSLSLRQDDAAGAIGVSENFLGKVERGADTVQWSKLFQVMEQLGIRITVEIPDEAAPLFHTESGKLAARRYSD